MEYIRSAHSVYLLTYHIVFVTKYRKPVINDEISEFLKDHIGYLCTRFDAELLTAETDRDHIHLLVSMTPKTAPSDLVRVLKTQTSREIHLDPQMDAHVKKYIYGERSTLTRRWTRMSKSIFTGMRLCGSHPISLRRRGRRSWKRSGST